MGEWMQLICTVWLLILQQEAHQTWNYRMPKKYYPRPYKTWFIMVSSFQCVRKEREREGWREETGRKGGREGENEDERVHHLMYLFFFIQCSYIFCFLSFSTSGIQMKNIFSEQWWLSPWEKFPTEKQQSKQPVKNLNWLFAILFEILHYFKSWSWK